MSSLAVLFSKIDIALTKRVIIAAFWLALLLVIVLKFVFTYHAVGYSLDGSYYLDVARGVRDGAGLVTNASLYHHGYETFPHPTAVSPLWPLVLGWAGRVFPLLEVARWGTAILYVTSLIGAYLCGREWTRLKADKVHAKYAFHLGHIMVLVTALVPDFFYCTSLGYTEGLAFTLFFLGCYRISRRLEFPSLIGGIEIGTWCALVFLTRSSLLVLLLGVLCAGTVAWKSFDKRILLMMAIGVGVAFFGIIIPWAVYVFSFVDAPSASSLLRFDQARASSLLSPFTQIVENDSVGSTLGNIFLGVKYAFSSSTHSFTASFHWMEWAVPLSLFCAVLWIERRQDRWELIRSCISAKSVFAVSLSVGMFLTIFLLHRDSPGAKEWAFHRRYVMVCVPLVAFSLWFLLRGSRLFKVCGGILLMMGVVNGVASIVEVTSKEMGKERAGEYWSTAGPEYRRDYPKLIEWLNKERRSRGAYNVAIAGHPQPLLPFVSEVGFHEIFKKSSPRDLEMMHDIFGVDYLIVQKGMRWPVFSDHVAVACRFSPFAEVGVYQILKSTGYNRDSSAQPRSSLCSER